MGRSEVSVSTKSLLGSTTKIVIEKSDIPVLTVRNREPHSYRHMLVPLDLSAPVGLQLAKAIEIAMLLKAIVTVCTILHSSGARLETAYRRRLLEIKNLFSNYGIFCRAKLEITEKRVADRIFSEFTDNVVDPWEAEENVMQKLSDPKWIHMMDLPTMSTDEIYKVAKIVGNRLRSTERDIEDGGIHRIV